MVGVEPTPPPPLNFLFVRLFVSVCFSWKPPPPLFYFFIFFKEKKSMLMGDLKKVTLPPPPPHNGKKCRWVKCLNFRDKKKNSLPYITAMSLINIFKRDAKQPFMFQVMSHFWNTIFFSFFFNSEVSWWKHR